MDLERLRALADTVVAVQDRDLGRMKLQPLAESVAALEATRRERYARAQSQSRVRRATLGALGAAAALFAVGGGVFGWFGASGARPLAFEVGFARERGVIGAPLAAPATESLPLHFSDGTDLVLAKTTSARVVSIAPEGAKVVVERGEIRAAVVPRARGAWLVAVGPFDVHVKGTRFDAAWDASRSTFTLRMYEGAVLLTSRCLRAPRGAAAGDVLQLACAGTTAAEAPTAASAPVLAPTSAEGSPATEPPTGSNAAGSAAIVAEAVRPVTAQTAIAAARLRQADRAPPGDSPASLFHHPDWRRLLAGGGAATVLDLLDDPGTADQICAYASARDLERLGEAARAAGFRARAVRVYEALRVRFRDSDAAALAAFHLGQVTSDQGGAPADARRAFAAYLAERPNGSLAQEALGRLLEIERSADTAAAKRLAVQYLKRFPTGPHAALARYLAAP